MNALSRRRGACPALSAPMATGDGLLVRLVPADGIFAPRALVGLARAAQAFGNGIVEVTARGSLQIRGLAEESVGPLNDAVAALALVPREGLAIDASPLAGIDAAEIADARLLAGEIGAAVAAAGLLPRLGPKVSVVIDGGGACPLDASKADVRLQAVRALRGVAWRIALAGDAARAHPLAKLGRREAIAAVVDLLARIAALGRAARMEDVLRRSALDDRARGAASAHDAFSASSAPQGPQSPLSRVRGRGGEGEECLDAAPQPTRTQANSEADPGADLAPRPSLAHRSPKTRPGPLHLHPLADGSFARGIGLPFGALEAETFIALIEAAEQAGAREIRLASGRALLAIGLTQDGAACLERAAATLGLLTDPADPRGFVAACPGAPACASGLLPARALAPQVARALAPLLDGSFEVHVSGCAKGCAHPAPAAVTLVGREPTGARPNDLPVGNLPAVDFPIALVREGTAEGAALTALAPSALIPTLTRLAAPGRQPGESGAQALSRLLAQAFLERSA
ncbi:precorrin-3B synthase [Xanthobacter sp. DSM 24535]|uniref:precorrin-3B synthase n=1 Tax=Roseixanthobacter psychrophilus TaxID=3119917 RepID=UPI00372825A3